MIHLFRAVMAVVVLVCLLPVFSMGAAEAIAQ